MEPGRRNLLIAAVGCVVVIAVIIIVVLADDDGAEVPATAESPTSVDDPSPGAVETVRETVTETVRPTETETQAVPELEPTPATDPETQSQTFIVGPQEPVTTQPSDEDAVGGQGVVQFSVVGRYGGGPLPEQLQLGWVPCDNTDPTVEPVVFADEDGDGLVDDLGVSDTDAAMLRTVNGDTFDNPDESWPTTVPVENDTLTFAFESFQADCLVPVVFTDDDVNGELNVGADGVPTEPFGVAQVTWTG